MAYKKNNSPKVAPGSKVSPKAAPASKAAPVARVSPAQKASSAAPDADDKMAVSKKGLWLMVAGLVVMAAGFILLAGGGSDDPAVFNYDMFNFRRLIAAPIVIVAGLIVELVAIMGWFKQK